MRVSCHQGRDFEPCCACEGGAALRQVIRVGFDGVRDVQAQVLELGAQGPPGDAQQEGGPGLVPAGVVQDAREQEPV